ncbi:hypothetical protein D3C75_1289340 [compost metagenome]
MNAKRHSKWATRGIAANQLHIVVIELFEQTVAEGFKPAFIDFRKGYRQRQPAWISAHRSQIA